MQLNADSMGFPVSTSLSENAEQRQQRVQFSVRQKPIPEKPSHDIWFQGQIIGEAKPSDVGGLWHVSIKLPVPARWPDYVLIQGHAATVQDAILKAINESISFHKKAIDAIEEFDEDVFVQVQEGGA